MHESRPRPQKRPLKPLTDPTVIPWRYGSTHHRREEAADGKIEHSETAGRQHSPQGRSEHRHPLQQKLQTGQSHQPAFTQIEHLHRHQTSSLPGVISSAAIRAQVVEVEPERYDRQALCQSHAKTVILPLHIHIIYYCSLYINNNCMQK